MAFYRNRLDVLQRVDPVIHQHRGWPHITGRGRNVLVGDFLPFRSAMDWISESFSRSSSPCKIHKLIRRLAGFILDAITLGLQNNLSGASLFGKNIRGWRQETDVHLLEAIASTIVL